MIYSKDKFISSSMFLILVDNCLGIFNSKRFDYLLSNFSK